MEPKRSDQEQAGVINDLWPDFSDILPASEVCEEIVRRFEAAKKVREISMANANRLVHVIENIPCVVHVSVVSGFSENTFGIAAIVETAELMNQMIENEGPRPFPYPENFDVESFENHFKSEGQHVPVACRIGDVPIFFSPMRELGSPLKPNSERFDVQVRSFPKSKEKCPAWAVVNSAASLPEAQLLADSWIRRAYAVKSRRVPYKIQYRIVKVVETQEIMATGQVVEPSDNPLA